MFFFPSRLNFFFSLWNIMLIVKISLEIGQARRSVEKWFQSYSIASFFSLFAKIYVRMILSLTFPRFTLKTLHPSTTSTMHHWIRPQMSCDSIKLCPLNGTMGTPWSQPWEMAADVTSSTWNGNSSLERIRKLKRIITLAISRRRMMQKVISAQLSPWRFNDVITASLAIVKEFMASPIRASLAS